MKRHNWLLALVAILIFITGCNPSPETMEQGPGVLRVILGNVTRTLESNISLDTARYELVAEPEASGLDSVVVPISITETQKIVTLTPGNWKVTVWAINDKGVRIGSGTSSVLIEANKETSCSMTIEENKGLGVLNFRLSGVYQENVITAEIRRSLGDTSPITLDLHKANGVYYATEKLENGSYIMKVNLNGVPIKSDAFRIVANAQTNADVNVSAENRIVITNGADIPENRISLSNVIDGIVENGKVYTIHSEQPAIWFVDGKLVESVPTRDFTWSPDSLSYGSIHEIGAVSGCETFGILNVMKVKVGGVQPITPVVKNSNVMAGDEIQITFENIPDVPRVDFEIRIGGSTLYRWISRDRNTLLISIPADIPVGENDVVFTVNDGSSLKIENLHLTVSAYVPAEPITMVINPVCYIGDGFRLSFPNALPFGMSAILSVDGKEFRSDLHKGAINEVLGLDGIQPGNYECTVKLYNGGNEIQTTGNTLNVEIKEYMLPSISISAVSPVYPGDTMELHLSEALPVAIGATVFCKGRNLGYIQFNPGKTIDTIWIPRDFAAGKYTLSFDCWYNREKVEIPTMDITVEEFEIPAMEFKAPKYVNRYDNLVLENPAIRDLDVEFLLAIDGNPMARVTHKWKGNDLVVYIGNFSDGVHTLTGVATANGKEVSITPVEFTVTNAYFGFEYQKSYVSDAVNYEFSSSLENTSGLDEFIGAEATLHITDSVESSGPFVLDDIPFSWTYSGKKPFLELTAELRAKDGTLLFRKRYAETNFEASIEGPKYFTLPAGGSVTGDYSVFLNRNDIDWGTDIPFAWSFERDWLGERSTVSLNINQKGMYGLNLHVARGMVYDLVCSTEILVSEEIIDTSIDFRITPVNRPRYSPDIFVFDIESSEPISKENVFVTILMDGLDVSDYFYTYKQDDSHLLECALNIPSFIEMGKRLDIEASLLGTDGSVIQKSSTSYEIEDLYMVAWDDYRTSISDSLSLEMIGSDPNETFTFFYDDNIELDIPGNHGYINSYGIHVFLSELGFGPHSLVAVSKSNPNRRSAVFSWYSSTGLELQYDSLLGIPSDKMNIKVNLIKDPTDQLPDSVEYSLWYKYEGHPKVTMPSNVTGEFAVPADVMDGLALDVGYEALCSGKTFTGESYIQTQNCRFAGLPEFVPYGSKNEYTLTLNWYNDRITYDNYDFTWYINGNEVGTGRTISTVLPSNEDMSVACYVVNKQDNSISSWVSLIVPVK